MKHIEPDFLRTKLIEFENYKPDIPSVGIFDEPTRCYPINKEWATIVMGLVSWLTEPDLWENADDERYIAIQAISDFLVGGDCMSCEDVIDCLETDANYQAFQYQQLQTQLETTQDHLDQLEQQYDNTPQSINPTIPGAAPDATQQDALCYALEQFVKLYAVVKLNLLQRKNSLQVLWDRMRTAVVKLYNQSTSLLGFNPSDSIFSCFVDDTTAISALQSDGSLLSVACCLRDELDSVTISQTTFNAAVSSCLASLTGDSHDILCLIDNDNNLQVYLSFLEAYGVALERQIDGETLTCNCATATGAYFQDFTTGAGDWTVDAGNVTGGGITSVVSGQPEAITVSLRSATAWACNRFELTYTRQSDGSFIDDTRIIGWSNIGTGAGRVDVYERDEPVTGLTQITLCIDTLSTAKRNDWGIYLRDNNAGNTITLEQVKVWSDIDPIPDDITDNEQIGC